MRCHCSGECTFLQVTLYRPNHLGFTRLAFVKIFKFSFRFIMFVGRAEYTYTHGRFLLAVKLSSHGFDYSLVYQLLQELCASFPT